MQRKSLESCKVINAHLSINDEWNIDVWSFMKWRSCDISWKTQVISAWHAADSFVPLPPTNHLYVFRSSPGVSFRHPHHQYTVSLINQWEAGHSLHHQPLIRGLPSFVLFSLLYVCSLSWADVLWLLCFPSLSPFDLSRLRHAPSHWPWMSSHHPLHVWWFGLGFIKCIMCNTVML